MSLESESSVVGHVDGLDHIPRHVDSSEFVTFSRPVCRQPWVHGRLMFLPQVLGWCRGAALGGPAALASGAPLPVSRLARCRVRADGRGRRPSRRCPTVAGAVARGGAADVLPAARLSRRARGERADDPGPGRGSTSIPTAACGSSRCAATCPTPTARSEREPSAASSCSRTTTTMAGWTGGTVFLDGLVLPRDREGARRRRAGRRAAEPLARARHQRRPEGRHEGARARGFRPRRRAIPSTTPTA